MVPIKSSSVENVRCRKLYLLLRLGDSSNYFEEPQQVISSTQQTCDSGVHDQRPIATTISTRYFPLPRPPLDKGIAERTGHNVTYSFAETKVRKYHGISRAARFASFSSSHLLHDPRPYRRPAPSEQPIEYTKHIQRGQIGCHPPYRQHRRRNPRRRNHHARRNMQLITKMPHQHQPHRRRNIHQYNRQRRQEMRHPQRRPRIRRQIDRRQKVPGRFHHIRKLIREKQLLGRKPLVQRLPLDFATNLHRNPRLHPERQRC